MVRLIYTFRASGDDFSPTDAEARSGHLFTEKRERGEIAPTGRYRGRAVPYGWAELRSAADTDGGPNAPFVRAASALAAASSAAGATQRVVHLDVAFREQCNFEMSRDDIADLAKIGVPLTISCFQDDT